MDLDRPHHRTPSTSTSTPTGELFVCFTSRLSSSSSMKLSKSILSPGRARDPSVSLSTSLSRRLRTNGSIKAGQASPMFPSSAKKRGSAFENPEPSSPKVTCIGQVRVKTKKKVKHTRSLSKRRSGDLSFRKLEQAQEGMNLGEERDRLSLQNQRPPLQGSSSVHYQQQECVPHRNQRWVHLPLTICEALRAFGAEFSCLFPCRSSCFSANEREKEEKGNGSKDSDHNAQQQQQQQQQRSCGAVFARWLVALQDGEGGKGREIELVVAGGDDEERIAGRPSTTMRSSRSRRHVFEDIDFKDESFQAHKGDGQEAAEEEEKARVSICIPPKNALLLMRCRSDPMKMAALTNRFWETPAATKDEDSDGDGDEAAIEVQVEIQKAEAQAAEVMEKECEEVAEQNVSSVNLEEKEEEEPGEETTMEMEVLSTEQEEAQLKPEEADDDEEEEEEEEEMEELELEHQQEDSELVSADSHIDQQNTENMEPDNQISEQEVGEEEGSTTPLSSSSPINSPEQTSCETEENTASITLEASLQEEDGESGDDENTEETTGHESEEEEEEEEDEEEEEEEEEEESDTEIENTTLKEELEEQEPTEDETVKKVSKKEEDVLPECLLLMMCEPKLSMEVSKETWVCSTDFIRWPPERQQVKVRKTDASDDSKKRLSTDNKKSSGTTTTNPTRPAPPDNKNHHLLQPPRSSCSLPPRSSCSLPSAAVSGVSMASMIEQKLVNAVGYEPFVLTRCKSEPMRTAAKLAPEPCFWKNRKLEPHRRATFGFGAAGVGF